MCRKFDNKTLRNFNTFFSVIFLFTNWNVVSFISNLNSTQLHQIDETHEHTLQTEICHDHNVVE